MPQMGGPRLAEALRLGRPQLKVILMSGYTGDVPMPGDKSKEGIHFMQKPFTMAALARKVREALGRPSRLTRDAITPDVGGQDRGHSL